MRRSAEGEVGKTVASGDEGQKKERGQTSKIDVAAAAKEQKQARFQVQRSAAPFPGSRNVVLSLFHILL